MFPGAVDEHRYLGQLACQAHGVLRRVRCESTEQIVGTWFTRLLTRTQPAGDPCTPAGPASIFLPALDNAEEKPVDL